MLNTFGRLGYPARTRIIGCVRYVIHYFFLAVCKPVIAVFWDNHLQMSPASVFANTFKLKPDSRYACRLPRSAHKLVTGGFEHTQAATPRRRIKRSESTSLAENV